MFPRLGIIALMATNRPPEDFWPPQTTRLENDRPAPMTEPAMLLRLAGVAVVIAFIVATALVVG